jgi:hypothetical protein
MNVGIPEVETGRSVHQRPTSVSRDPLLEDTGTMTIVYDMLHFDIVYAMKSRRGWGAKYIDWQDYMTGTCVNGRRKCYTPRDGQSDVIWLRGVTRY